VSVHEVRFVLRVLVNGVKGIQTGMQVGSMRIFGCLQEERFQFLFITHGFQHLGIVNR
jgi:hypothetical protein